MPQEQKREYEIILEGKEEVLRVNANTWTNMPSIEDNPLVMAAIMDKLIENPEIKRVILNQKKNYTYGYDQVQLLIEIAHVYNHLIKTKKILNIQTWGFDSITARFYGEKLGTLQYLTYNLLRSDPIGAFVETRRLLREERIHYEKETNPPLVEVRKRYLTILQYAHDILEKTRLITLIKDQIAGHHLGDRDIYRIVFRAAISPDFMYAQLQSQQPLNGQEIDFYTLGNHDVTLFTIPGEIKTLYHLNPEEYKLTQDEYELLELARNVLSEHQPREEEFLDPQRMRKTFYNIGRDLINELAQQKNLLIDYERIEHLAGILVRYTVGFGLIEALLTDSKVQDITVNSPVGTSPIHIVHQDYGACSTNITPNYEEAEGWATKLRLLSGRPLDEANPVLDTELHIPGARSRVAVMTKPLSPTGLAFALRRHRDKPWTLPLFIHNKTISPLGAGLLSFLIDGARTLLVAGTRSSGKTSFLSSFLVEIMRTYRILTIEDTLELPVTYLRNQGYNIQHMKVRSALTSGGAEVSADEGIRTSLRLGDSSLIVGEVRSVEARALYEAMRVGALANVVAGTIHGATPYGVYDRVVNDLGVPKTSFKATDIITITNPIKSPDGLRQWKRVLQITEVRKHWNDDPLAEQGFVDLMRYNTKTDMLEPTDDLKNGESEILKIIGGNVKEWAGNWDAIWENILLRSTIKRALVDYAHKTNNYNIIESPFVIASNDAFHRISDHVKQEIGALDNKRIFFLWEDWLKTQIKLNNIPAP